MTFIGIAPYPVIKRHLPYIQVRSRPCKHKPVGCQSFGPMFCRHSVAAHVVVFGDSKNPFSVSCTACFLFCRVQQSCNWVLCDWYCLILAQVTDYLTCTIPLCACRTSNCKKTNQSIYRTIFDTCECVQDMEACLAAEKAKSAEAESAMNKYSKMASRSLKQLQVSLLSTSPLTATCHLLSQPLHDCCHSKIGAHWI